MTETIAQTQAMNLHLRSGKEALHILKDINFTIGRGEVVSIVGPSGSGKTSMLMVMGGLERASDGLVSVGGAALGGMNEDRLALFRRAHVGIVFQAFRLVPTMSALENVAIPLELAGAADAFDRAAEGLKAVGLGHRTGHYPDQLSGGEQQRVALARAFVAGPSLLLADEPTGNLDGHTGEQVIELMFDLKRRFGTTLVLITHDLDLARRCQRTIHLADGRIVADETEGVSGLAVAGH